MKNFFLIKWGEDFTDSFNYGAEMMFLKNGKVKYSSPLMPAGEVIKTWKSETLFHADRKSPMLPLLTNGKRYFVQFNADFGQKGNVQLKIEFFNRDGQRIKEEYFKTLQGEFTYPDEATTYKIYLVNKHHQEILFDCLLIMEVDLYEKYMIHHDENWNVVIFQKHHRDTEQQDTFIISKPAADMAWGTIDEESNNQIFVFSDCQFPDAVGNIKFIYDFMEREVHRQNYRIKYGSGSHSCPIEYQEMPNVLATLLPGKFESQHNIGESAVDRIDAKFLVNRMAREALTDMILGGEL